MDNEKILERVIALFSRMTEEEEITEESEIVDDLGISSMDVLFLISSMEEEFGIKISEKLIRKMVTVSDVVEIIADLMG